MNQYLRIALIGVAMGAANVIPGVSGGTIAFITGIYERLIKALKSFDAQALKLALSFKIKDLYMYVDGPFLLSLLMGVAASIVTFAKLLEFLLCSYTVPTNAFFFGLILASVYLVGKEIKTWNTQVIAALLIGAALAFSIIFFNPANSNTSMIYLFICGMVAISSMILPGLSGSYVLLIMGNYLLVISAINDLFGMNFSSLAILIPFALGCGIGLLLFSRLLAYVFDKAKEATIGLLTGFVFGSLAVIWPWKETQWLTNDMGQFVDKKGVVLTAAQLCKDGVVLNYERYLPQLNAEFALAVGLAVAGILIVVGIERWGAAKQA